MGVLVSLIGAGYFRTICCLVSSLRTMHQLAVLSFPVKQPLEMYQAHPPGQRLWGRPRALWRDYISQKAELTFSPTTNRQCEINELMLNELCCTDKSEDYKSIHIQFLYLSIQGLMNGMFSEDIIIWCNYHSLSDMS